MELCTLFIYLLNLTTWGGGGACGILLPQPGSEPVALLWKCRLLTTGPLGNSLGTVYFKWVNHMVCELHLNKAVFKKPNGGTEYRSSTP